MSNYEKCDKCGGEIIDDEPSMIPWGEDEIMVITDQKCTKCGCVYIGKYQKRRTVKSKELHDRLSNFYEGALHPKTGI